MTFNVDEVLSKLTVKEKAALLSGKDFWHTVPLPEHGVPSLRFSDGPNGLRGTRFFDSVKSACFPCGTALGSTWDQELLNKAGDTMAEEAKAKGVHVILGPTANIQRSPLGGRGFESFAEDPVLSGLLAAAEINGIQKKGIVACMKHFVCNDLEHERNSSDSQLTERALREVYLMPFMLATRDAKPRSFMTGYNKVNGVSCSHNSKLLKEIVRGDWNWEGLIMSDWFGTYTTTEAIEAGLDMEMPAPPEMRAERLVRALNSKQIHHHVVDERVRNVLEFIKQTMEESGVPENGEEGMRDTKETAALLRQLAADGCVLLKNENNVLPLSKEKTTAVIGPNAKVITYCGGGSASLRPYYAVSPFEGISGKLKNEPKYAFGVNTFKNLPLIDPYLKTADGKTGFTLRAYDKPHTDKERKLLDTRTLESMQIMIPDWNPVGPNQAFYFEIEADLEVATDGVYDFGLVVCGTGTVYLDGQEVVDNSKDQKLSDNFFGAGTVEERGSTELKAGKKYKMLMHYGSQHTSTLRSEVPDFGGGLRLGLLQRRGADELINEAVEVAKSVDQVVLSLGLNSDWESEGYDRLSMDFPPNVDKLVEAVTKVNKNVVVINQSGTPVTLPWIKSVPAFVQAWYGGNETGNGIADVIFGDVNPSGRLPLTFPERLEDNPAYLSYRTENGRVWYSEDVYTGYRYYEATKRAPLFPFGHGLSYSTFELKNAKVAVMDDKVVATVDVANTSKVDGKHVVQVYIAQKNPAIARPVKELKGFAKVEVAAGKSATATVEIPFKYATSYWNEIRDSWISEADEYEVLFGNSSADIAATASFEVKETTYWNGI